MDNLESLNHRLRQAALWSLIYVGGLLLALLGLSAYGQITGAMPVGRSWNLARLLAASVIGVLYLRHALLTLSTHLDPNHLVRRTWRGQASVPWRTVGRITLKWRKVILEQVDGTRTVISLRFTPDPDEVYKAICGLVPLAAFDAPDA